ncbi:MAG: hypothetical protein ACXABY_21175 [Candidatus Thorarchaeota archaeon]|jgi:hypothetical protein
MAVATCADPTTVISNMVNIKAQSKIRELLEEMAPKLEAVIRRAFEDAVIDFYGRQVIRLEYDAMHNRNVITIDPMRSNRG